MSPHQPTRRVRIDLRLLLGLLLVLGSVAGVTALLAAADRTEPVYVAATGIAAGETITPADLAVVRVRFADAEAHYLTPASGGERLVASRFLGPGELIPLSALGEDRLLAVDALVVEPALPLSDSIGPGSRVSVWSTPGEGAAPPRVLAAGVEVRAVDTGPTFLDTGGGGRVELMVPDDAVPAILSAVAAKDSIAVVAQPVRR